MSHTRSSWPLGVAEVVTLVFLTCIYAQDLPSGKDPASPTRVLVTSIAGANFVTNAVATILFESIGCICIPPNAMSMSLPQAAMHSRTGKCSTASLAKRFNAHCASCFILMKLILSSISSSVSKSDTFLTMLGLSFRMQGHPAEAIAAGLPSCAAGLFQL
jgi:hypothetical protein